MKLFGLFIAAGLLGAQAHASTVVLKLSKDAKVVKGSLTRADGKLSPQDIDDFTAEWESLKLDVLKTHGASLSLGGYELKHSIGQGEKFSLTLRLWSSFGDTLPVNSGLVYSQARTTAGYYTDLPSIELSNRSFGLTKNIYAKINANQNIECVIDSAVIDTVLTGEYPTNYLRIKSAKCE